MQPVGRRNKTPVKQTICTCTIPITRQTPYTGNSAVCYAQYFSTVMCACFVSGSTNTHTHTHKQRSEALKLALSKILDTYNSLNYFIRMERENVPSLVWQSNIHNFTPRKKEIHENASSFIYWLSRLQLAGGRG